MWFQNRRSKDKRDASYREAMRDEPSNQSTPVATPPLYPQSPVISTSLPSTTAPTPTAPSPSSIAQGKFHVLHTYVFVLVSWEAIRSKALTGKDTDRTDRTLDYLCSIVITPLPVLETA